MVLLVVRDLLLSVRVRDAQEIAYRVRLVVRVQDDPPLLVARSAARGLDERRRGAEKALLVRVEYRDERDLREVEPFAQEVDSDKHVELALPQPLENRDALYGVNVAVQVLDAYALVVEVLRKILRRALRQSGNEHAVLLRDDPADLRDEVVDLVRERTHLDHGVEEPRRTYHLLRDGLRLLVLVVARRRRAVDYLVHLRVEFVEGQRTVVLRAGKAEAELDELRLARLVAVVHRAYLRDGHVALVDDGEEVVGEVVQQALRRGARRAAGERARVVLDSVAVAELAHHLDVVLGALLQSLRLKELPLRRKELEPVRKLRLDARECRLELVLPHHELLRRRDDRGGHGDTALPGERIERADGVYLVAEELDSYRLRLVRGEDVDDIAAHAERARGEVVVVSRVLRLDEALEERVASAGRIAALDPHGEVAVFVALAESVDAADGCDDDDVAASDERVRRGEAVALDLLVDGRVLLDVGVRLRDVRLRLVVVVVRDEVLDGVLGEELLQLREELRGKRLVVREDQRRTVPLRDQVRHRERLAGARHALQDKPVVAALQALVELLYRLRLVAGRLELRLEPEYALAHFPSLPAVIHFAVSVSPLSVVADLTSFTRSGSA